jgi:hypothetical protein
MAQPARNRPPLPVRIAAWRRRIVVGSLGLFLAAWLAVAGLGRQAASNASAGTATTTSGTTTQTQAPGSQAQSSDSQANSVQPDYSQSAPQDLSSATTSQS